MFACFHRLCLAIQIAIFLSASTTFSFPTPKSEKNLDDSLLSYTTAEAGNPFVEGWYADPDTAIYEGQYWIYPTASDVYEKQTYLDAFSSPDLIHWTKHGNILTVASVKWATKAMWAPASVFRNGKYYLYFSANDIQEGEPEKGLIGGVGVAVADRPEGPYVDALGKPLIGEYHNGAQPIDQDVFIDDDGQAYIYYGGHGFANVAKLNEDMITLGKMADGSTFKSITPESYVEGPQMLKRNGIYYFMWSEGGWGLPNYAVSYAMADNPLGPFQRRAKILEQDSAVAKSSGHNGVLNVPGTDIYYIFYHRRALSDTARDHRALAYDRMYFNDDGSIAPVRMRVHDNFADGNMLGWTTAGGQWAVRDQHLAVATRAGTGLAVLDTNFADVVFDATVAVPDASAGSGSAGLIFRATRTESVFRGYYVGISTSGVLSLQAFSGPQLELSSVSAPTAQLDQGSAEYRISVAAIGDRIEVYVGDMEVPKLAVSDRTFVSGMTGVVGIDVDAWFGDVVVERP